MRISVQEQWHDGLIIGAIWNLIAIGASKGRAVVVLRVSLRPQMLGRKSRRTRRGVDERCMREKKKRKEKENQNNA